MPRPNTHTRDLIEAVQELLDHARETGQTATQITLGSGILTAEYHEDFHLLGLPVEVREGLASGRVVVTAGKNTVGGTYAGPFDPTRDMPSRTTATIKSAVVCPKGTVENLGSHDGMGFPNAKGSYYLMRMYEDVGAGEIGQDVLMLCPKHQVDK